MNTWLVGFANPGTGRGGSDDDGAQLVGGGKSRSRRV